MPQLPQTFDAYPTTIILDGSGNGTITFQPNGSNIAITRLFVQVSTQVKQATVTLTKGGVTPIGTIVSGSTGGLASGQIFLTDGQTLTVSWTGGDAGATATATFSGKQVSFNEIGSDSITWSDPIAASDGTLIFPAIKSPNYVSGSSGWMIDRNGSAEFNNVSVRGNFISKDPTSNAYVAIFASGGNADIDLYPGDPGTGWRATDGIINSSTFVSASNGFGSLVFQTPLLIVDPGGPIPDAFIMQLYSQSPGLTAPPYMAISGDLQLKGTDIGRFYRQAVSSTSNSPAVGTTITKILTINSFTFVNGRAYAIEIGGGVLGSAVGILANFTVYKSVGGSVAGQPQYCEFYNTYIPSTVSGVPVYGRAYVKNNTGADITTDLGLCVVASSGTVTHLGSAGKERYMKIIDVGKATDQPFNNATVVS